MKVSNYVSYTAVIVQYLVQCSVLNHHHDVCSKTSQWNWCLVLCQTTARSYPVFVPTITCQKLLKMVK